MRKITAIVLTLALLITMVAGATASVSASSSDVPEYIRVGLDGKTVSAGTVYTLTCSGGFKIYNYNSGGTCTVLKDLSSSKTVYLVAGSSDITVKDSGGTQVYTMPNNSTYFVGCADLEGGIFTEGSTSYRGGLMFYKSSNRYNYINVINTEKYLYGVLPKEMSSGYPQEALKAQAVAARSYVAGNVNKKHKAQGFDLCNTTDCQVYGGVSCEAPTCSSAVSSTDGMIVYYNGSPADTCVYCSSNGGYIEASKDIWSGDLGYLQGKEDPYDPQTPWTAKFTKAELQKKIDIAGYGIGTLTGVNVLEKTAGGSVTKLELVGTNGSKVLAKTSIRSFFGAAVVKSLHFEITASEFSGVTAIIPTYFLKDSVNLIEIKLQGLYVLDGNGNKIQIGTGSSVSAQTANGVVSLPVSGVKGSGGGDDVDGIEISGKGYGHCIGMSQTGAKVMAQNGFTYDQILKFYYTGVEIK